MIEGKSYNFTENSLKIIQKNPENSLNLFKNPENSLNLFKNPENSLKSKKYSKTIHCTQCGKEFTRKDNLKVHIKSYCKNIIGEIINYHQRI